MRVRALSNTTPRWGRWGLVLALPLAMMEALLVNVVPAGAASPTLVTQASPGIFSGGDATDTATLAGGDAPTGTITFDLYAPDDPNCTGNPSGTTVDPVNGNGTYTSDTFLPEVPGTYHWVASYSGDTNNSPVFGTCGDANESVVVTAPATTTLVTQASPSVLSGGEIHDTATLSGGNAPTGTITFNLYLPSDPTCTGTPEATSTETVLGNGSYDSVTFLPTTLGTWHWVASYSGDTPNLPASGTCGDANESVGVFDQVTPALVGQTSPATSTTLGTAISDVATLSGGNAPTGTITFDLFGPTDPTCSGTPLHTSTATVDGSGTYDSDGFTPAITGTYNFIASYGGDALNAAVAGQCGAAAQSVVVDPVVTPTTVTPTTPVTSVVPAAATTPAATAAVLAVTGFPGSQMALSGLALALAGGLLLAVVAWRRRRHQPAAS
jgi:hypothetical protein